MNAPHFDGSTYEADRDHSRLTTQMQRVAQAVSDGAWHTLSELAQKSHGSEAAVSARLRDLRKPKFGGHTVEREYVGNGLWMYRVLAKDQPELF